MRPFEGEIILHGVVVIGFPLGVCSSLVDYSVLRYRCIRDVQIKVHFMMALILFILHVVLVIRFPLGVCSSPVDYSVVLFECIHVHIVDTCLYLNDRPN